MDAAAFSADENLRDAVIYRLQAIGEAFKERHPQVEWFKIQGLRHKIVHDYDTPDDTNIHRVDEQYVPPLLEQLRRILEEVA